MSLRTRAASFAAVSLYAALVAGLTSPGTAQGLKDSPITTLNALAQPQVPAALALNEATQADPATTVTPLPDVPAVELSPAVAQTEPADTDAAQDYSSLADAVAAQSAEVGERELRCLASGVYYESKGEPLAGQLAVAHTILNRTRSGRFPSSVCGVLTQRGQFSFVRGGVVPSAEGSRAWNTAVAIAKVAYDDLWDSAAPKALYFHARRVAPGWKMTRIASVGNHIFYR